MNRQPREADARSATQRPAIGEDNEAMSLLYVPLDEIPPGVELRWVREETLGQRDRGNLQKAMQVEGFVPVTTADIPSLAAPLLPGEAEDTTGLIRNGGLILMKRPTQVGDRFRANLAHENAEAIRSVTRDFTEKVGDGKNFKIAADSGITVTETTSDGKQRQGAKSPFPE